MEKYPKLINPNDNTAITINNTAFSIGRSLSCDHIIQSLDISRFHCIIKKKDSKWTLYDRSTNGTTVNSTLYKFNQSIDLKNGDVIKLGPGNLSFVFSNLNEDDIVSDSVVDKKRDPTSSSNILFPNDEALLEEAASLLAECLEQPSAEDEISPSTADHKSEKNDTAIDNNKREVNVEEPTSSKEKQSQSDDKTKRGNDAGNIDIMENELTCSICSELFIKAVTLNCSHTYCKYCIEEWRKNKKSCPICRTIISTIAPTLVLDNFIEKIISTQSDEMKETRKELIKQREDLVVNAAGSSSVSTTVENNSIIEIFSDNDDLDGDDSDASYPTDDDYEDYDYYESHYYGGYGRCFNCNQAGHWANGCPFKRR